MISIQQVSKVYGRSTLAVNDLSFDVENGSIVGFIGPNGAGKTTTLKMITGIVSPTKGDIILNGHNIQTDAIAAKREFGYVSDSPDLFLRLKGIEYLNFVADIYGMDSQLRKQRIESLAADFEMSSALSDKIVSYSHGMRQKMMIMGVLVHDPDIWILDEPLTGLDPQSSYVLKEMMRKRTQAGKSVLFSTHVLEVAEKLCDKIIIINHGTLLYDGTLEALKTQYENLSLEEIFLEVTQR